MVSPAHSRLFGSNLKRYEPYFEIGKDENFLGMEVGLRLLRSS